MSYHQSIPDANSTALDAAQQTVGTEQLSLEISSLPIDEEDHDDDDDNDNNG